ncbi:MAG TPA: SprT family zinc-dependent metalloprotease [Candidatus Binatia bacterium]|nr:SprT family zinc-dependent metalloprotease [Candidatus Binatia bacterium]
MVDPARGVIVTIPGTRRLGMAEGRRFAAGFVAEREGWIRGHVERQARQQAAAVERGPLVDGARALFLGREHRVAFVSARSSARRSTVLHDAGAGLLVVRLAGPDARQPTAVLADWCRATARASIDAAIADHAHILGVTPTGISIRDQRTRWGSASRNGRLSFSWRLILAPPEALETVVVHELAHLRIFGHGPAFWALVETRRPDHRTWRRWLREHSVELHAAFSD